MDSTNSASNQTSTSADNDDFDDEEDVHSQAHLSSLQNFVQPPASIASSSSIFDAFSPYFAPFHFPPPPPEAAPLSLDAAWNSPATAAAAAAMSPPPQPQFSSPSAAAAAPSQPPPRGSRKRARASRRPPTTVINTETSNFRAMVQQFTGFPTPPFAAAPFPARPRLDLFGAAAAGVVPPFLLRPSAHKVIPSPSSSSSSSSSSSASLFDHAIASIARSHLATTIGATPDPSNSIPSKYHDHDKFNLSLFDNNMQRAGEATFASPPFLQPPQPQMAPPPPPPQQPAAFPSDHSAAMNPRWHVEDQESERQNAERARSKFHFRNFHN